VAHHPPSGSPTWLPSRPASSTAAAAATRPGGTLVYSVCTISRAESEDVVDGFLAGHPEWDADPPVRLAPDTDGTDGFFIASLRRP